MQDPKISIQKFLSYRSRPAQSPHKRWLAIIDSNFKVLDPYERIYSFWRLFVTLSTLLFFFQIPLEICFTQQFFEYKFTYQFLKIIHCVALATLLADMLVSLNLGFYENGLFVNDRANIITRYLRSSLVIDLLGLLAASVTFLANNIPVNILKFLFMFKLVNLKRYDSEFMYILKSNRTTRLMYKFVRLITIMVWYTHILACIFFFIDYSFYLSNYNGYVDKGYLWLINAPAMPDIVGQYGWTVRYLYAFYWSINTVATVGYGDMYPMNPSQNLYLLLVILNICVLFGYFVNNVFAILAQYYQVSDKLSKQLSLVHYYFDKRKVPRKLRFQIQKYIQFIVNEEGERDIDAEQEILSKFSEAANRRICYEQYKTLINALPLDLNFDMKIQLASKTSRVVHFQDDVICTSNNTAYMIEKGRVYEYYSLSRKQNYTQKLTKPDLIRFYEFFAGCATDKEYRSKEYTALITLELADFMEVVGTEIKEEYFAVRDRLRTTESLSIIKHECAYCKGNHFQSVCQQIHLIVEPNTFNTTLTNINYDLNIRKSDFDRNRIKLEFVSRLSSGKNLGWRRKLRYLQVEDMDSLHNFSNYYPKSNAIRLEGFRLSHTQQNSSRLQ